MYCSIAQLKEATTPKASRGECTEGEEGKRSRFLVYGVEWNSHFSCWIHVWACPFAWLAFRRDSDYLTGLLKESNTRNLEWFNVCRLLGVSWSWRNKASRPKHQGQLSAWVWKWEETVWTLGLQPSNLRASPPFGDRSQKIRKFSWPKPELQLIPLASAQVPRSENKAFTPCFFPLKYQTYFWTSPPSSSHPQAAIPYRCLT